MLFSEQHLSHTTICLAGTDPKTSSKKTQNQSWSSCQSSKSGKTCNQLQSQIKANQIKKK